MKVQFLGVGSCLPEYEGADTANVLIDGHVLIDTGWNTVHNLLRAGVDPGQVTHVFFTHMHQDHYLGLAQFLFYRMNRYHQFGNLMLYGPSGLSEIVDRALLYAGFDRIHVGERRKSVRDARPEIIELPAQGEVCVDKLHVRFVKSRHAVEGRCYRLEMDGKSVTYTGDTAVFDGLAPFAEGSDVLIHEAAFGAADLKGANLYFHASAQDAARTARAAGVRELYLVHMPLSVREDAHQAAEQLFAHVCCPSEGDIITI